MNKAFTIALFVTVVSVHHTSAVPPDEENLKNSGLVVGPPASSAAPSYMYPPASTHPPAPPGLLAPAHLVITQPARQTSISQASPSTPPLWVDTVEPIQPRN